MVARASAYFSVCFVQENKWGGKKKKKKKRKGRISLAVYLPTHIGRVPSNLSLLVPPSC